MSNESVLVTGAATGIGLACVELACAHGYEVIAVDKRADVAQACAPFNAHALVVDLADAAAADAEVRAAIDGADLVGVVNNAGFGFRKPFYDTAIEEWDELQAVNLRACQVVTAAAWPALRKPGSAVVNISSIHADLSLTGHAAYSASKAGVEGLTRAMALDAAEHGVRVNAVAPGFVRTRLWTDWIGALPPLQAQSEDAEVRGMIPLGRPAEPSEIAEVAMWLLGPKSSYISGTTIHADGAVSARASYRAGH